MALRSYAAAPNRTPCEACGARTMCFDTHVCRVACVLGTQVTQKVVGALLGGPARGPPASAPDPLKAFTLALEGGRQLHLQVCVCACACVWVWVGMPARVGASGFVNAEDAESPLRAQRGARCAALIRTEEPPGCC
jgi:hypothetical protein